LQDLYNKANIDVEKYRDSTLQIYWRFVKIECATVRV